MLTKLARIISLSGKRENGFTLIELLIVVAIIAILAAIAIPQFSKYRTRGYNAAANSDSRNIRTTQEAMFADFRDYGASQATNLTPPQDTGAEASTTLYLVGADTATTNQTVSLSPSVTAATKVTTAAVAGRNKHTAYTSATGHASGDQFYGVDSNFANVYRKGFSTTLAIGNVLAAVPTSTDDATNADFTPANNWIQM